MELIAQNCNPDAGEPKLSTKLLSAEEKDAIYQAWQDGRDEFSYGDLIDSVESAVLAKQICQLCSGMGFYDGIGDKCTVCGGTGSSLSVPAPQVAQTAEGEAIYQVQTENDWWATVSKTIYDRSLDNYRRMVYAAPPQQPAAESVCDHDIQKVGDGSIRCVSCGSGAAAIAALSRQSAAPKMTEDQRACVEYFTLNPSMAVVAFDRLKPAAPPHSPIADSGHDNWFKSRWPNVYENAVSTEPDDECKLPFAMCREAWKAAVAAQPKADSGAGE